jgi:hypothetical protein
VDAQTLINAAIGCVCAAAGWWLRVLWEAQQRLQSDLLKLEKELPRLYVFKDDYQQDIAEIKAMLNKIFDKLDSKADK